MADDPSVIPNSPKSEPVYNDPELMTSVISFALSPHAMLTAVVPKNECNAHVFGEFERLVRNGAAGSFLAVRQSD